MHEADTGPEPGDFLFRRATPIGLRKPNVAFWNSIVPAFAVIPSVHLQHMFEINGWRSGFILFERVNISRSVYYMQPLLAPLQRIRTTTADVAGPSQSIDGATVRNAWTTISEPQEKVLIEQTVAQVFGVAGCDLRQATRGRAKVARARQVAMYLAHVACGMSLTEVGRVFARDRTTVSHACGVVEDGRDDPTFDRVLELLEHVVNAMVQPRSVTGEGRIGRFVQ